jgi:acyl dehydratase
MSTARFPIDESHVLQFARAVGDPNPIYSDHHYAAQHGIGAILTPPTFMMAGDHFDPTYSRRPQPGIPWFGSGRGASGTPGGTPQQTGFHAEQVFEYHRHPVVGDVLRVSERAGRRWEKQGRRGGVLRFRETISEFVDQHDLPTVTATFVGVTTEHLVDGPPTDGAASTTGAATDARTDASRDASVPPSATRDRLAQFSIGEQRTLELVDDLTRTQIVMYAGASGDFHPLHHDATFARSMGYPGIFAHGMLTMGLTSRLLTDMVGDAMLRRWSARFNGTVWPGDTLTATATVVALRAGPDTEVDLDVRTVNQHGSEVLRGAATAHIPAD